MKLQYMCLHSALDLWPPCHFELVFLATRELLKKSICKKKFIKLSMLHDLSLG